MIVLARLDTDEILPVHQIQLTRFSVVQSIKGGDRKQVMVGGAGTRGGLFRELDKVLFLKRLKSDSIFELVDVVDLVEGEGPLVTETLRSYLAIGAEVRPGERERSLFSLSLENVGRSSVFACRVACNELLRLARTSPYLFKIRHLERLRGHRSSVPVASRPVYRRLVRRVSQLLGAHVLGAEEAFPPGPARDELRGAINRFLALETGAERVVLLDSMAKAGRRRLRRFCEGALLDGAREVRTRAAWYLGEFGNAGSVEALAAGLVEAKGAERVARIEAIGKIGAPAGFPHVVKALERNDAVDAALEAAARIGGLEATNLLDRVERALSRTPGEEARLQRIRYYRGDAFAKAEAKRRRDAKLAWD